MLSTCGPLRAVLSPGGQGSGTMGLRHVVATGLARPTKPHPPRTVLPARRSYWCLALGIFLEFGFWDLELRPRGFPWIAFRSPTGLRIVTCPDCGHWPRARSCIQEVSDFCTKR